MEDFLAFLRALLSVLAVFAIGGFGGWILFKLSSFSEKSDEPDKDKGSRYSIFQEINYSGWSEWEKVWLSDFAGSYRRDRFVQMKDGVHHFVQYYGKPIDQPGPGSDKTKTDLARGWFSSMEEMAKHLGCEIVPE